MGLPFFFAGNISTGDAVIPLDEEASRHIVQVLRMKSGEQLLLTDGRGHTVRAEIESPHKKHCTVRPLSVDFTDRPSPNLTIAISLTKNTGRFEWFLEKATELGTAEIIPMVCERTEKQHARSERLSSICRSAMLQSSQAWMPAMSEPTSFRDVVARAAQPQRLFGHITRDTKKLSAALNMTLGAHIILIGPEGDFSSEEVSLAGQYGFEGVSFGSTILRVETAGIYAAAVYSALSS